MPYTPNEDEIILAGVKMYEHRWTKISALLPGRLTIGLTTRYSFIVRKKTRR